MWPLRKPCGNNVKSTPSTPFTLCLGRRENELIYTQKILKRKFYAIHFLTDYNDCFQASLALYVVEYERILVDTECLDYLKAKQFGKLLPKVNIIVSDLYIDFHLSLIAAIKRSGILDTRTIQHLAPPVEEVRLSGSSQSIFTGRTEARPASANQLPLRQ